MTDYRESLIDEICKQAEKKIAKCKDYSYCNNGVYLFVRYFEDTGKIQIDMRDGYDLNTIITTDISDLRGFLDRYL